MPAKNIDHDAVRDALIADGWTITDDPLTVVYGGRRLHVDLGVERARLGAERDGERIAVEVQSFVGESHMDSLHHAVGQYCVYRVVLNRTEPERLLFLAVRDTVYRTVFEEQLGQTVAADLQIRFLVYNATRRRIVQWISGTDTGRSSGS